MILSHKIQLNPSQEQIIALNKAVGVSRFAWNWALDKVKTKLENKELINILNLKKEFNSIKLEQYPWIYESPKDANQQPFTNLSKTLNRYFKNKDISFPKFKTKYKNDSFYVSNDKFKINNKSIYIPHIGLIRLTEPLRFQGKIMSAVVSRKAGRWFVAISVEIENYHKNLTSNNQIGLDLGITDFATLSDGQKFKSPKPLKANLAKLKRANQSLSRKKESSNNRRKAKISLQKIHYRITNIRKDFLHKFTSKLCAENQAIAIENLKVSNMVKNHKLSRAILDLGWHEFKRQLKYKCEIWGNDIAIIDTWFPSSKLCSDCGFKVNKMPLNIREWICHNCKSEHDRDINAANNLKNTLGYREIHASADTAHVSVAGQELKYSLLSII
jgi:putative transposase